MDNLAANFEITPNNPFNCSFELFATGTVWGSIDGNINNQTDLINLLNTKVDLTSFEELSQTVTNNYNELTGDITDLTTTVTDNYNTLSGQISDLTTTVNNNYTSLDNRLTTTEQGVLDLTDTVNDNYTELNGKITVNTDDIATIQNTINSYGDIVTYNAAYFATANQGALANTALQPNDNITLLNNNAGFITNTVNNLTNYYLKSETYTKTEVQQLIASIPQFSVVVVQTLPVTGERMVLYLVPKDGEAPDVYNEYIWVEDENEFELLGSTAVDLDGYATETYVDTGLATKQNTLVSGTNIKTINNVTVLGSGNIDIQSSNPAYGTSSTAGNVAEKEVSIPEITELNVGQILYIKPSNSATVANLTIKLNNFTAYPIRYNNGAITTTSDDLVWNQNFVSQFIFDGTYWQFAGRGYDNNSTYTLNVLFDRGNFVSGSGTYAITRYSICLQKPDMTWEKVTNTEEDYSLATNKTVNTHGFLLNGEMLYYSNSTVLTNGAVSPANTMYRQNSGFDIRYSMNTTGTGYTAGDYIYLVGTIGVDGLFYLDSTQWWTNTLPSTNDGKIYVKIGKYISGVSVSLELEHPAYYHNGTRICLYQSASNKQDTLVSGTNIKTVNNQSLLGSGDITIQGGGAVDSVNGQTGIVVLTASDVGALPDSTVIPTVNNATITFTQGGTTKGTITLNQSNNQTIALDAGGSGGSTWGSITGTLSDQTDLQNALNAKLNISDITEYTAQEVETLWGSI